MFDIGFSELLVIGVVALIVLGPERLPKVARTMGALLGRLNRYVAQVKQDIDRDMRLEDLRKMQQDMKETAQKYEIMAGETVQEVKQEAGQVSRVLQAMAATDGGLALREFERMQDESKAPGEGQGGADPEPAAVPADVPAEVPALPQSASGTEVPGPESTQADAGPRASGRTTHDHPDGPVG